MHRLRWEKSHLHLTGKVAIDAESNQPVFLADNDGTLYQADRVKLEGFGGINHAEVILWEPIYQFDDIMQAINAAEREYECTS